MSLTKSVMGRGDIIVPCAVVGAVAMMILPLPCVVLDSLLVCNIALSLLLLLGAVYLSEPERFTVLPTVLLLSTLFRLSLNISTTRQLLGSGEAPEIVVGFGNFVVGGNLVVGVVIFSIITLVQFLVIAKGAERVAEVAARFALDAMPGKQMAIDADLRSGVLSLADARQRRLELQREAKLYGSLDGAMKFVKGDAIIGILVIIVNVIAGLFIGTTLHKLALGEALRRYTLFSVGDGLVSQIPALLVSVAAGIAVTKVGADGGALVGNQLYTQLGREPRAVTISGAVLMILGLMPGLPLVPFWALGGLLLGCGVITIRRGEVTEDKRQDREFRPQVWSGFVIRIPNRVADILRTEQQLPILLGKFRERTFEKLGIILPDVGFEIGAGAKVEVLLHGAVVAIVEGGKFGVGGEAVVGEVSEQLCSYIEETVMRHLGEFMTDTHTRILLEAYQPVCEDLINSVIPQASSVTVLTALLKSLVREGVSIRPIPQILQAVAEHSTSAELVSIARVAGDSGSSGEKGEASESVLEVSLLQRVRRALGRSISRANADEGWTIRAWQVAVELDLLLSKVSWGRAPVSPEISGRLIEVVAEIVEKDVPLVVVCSARSRLTVANILLAEFAAVQVLAYEELSDEVSLEILGELSIEESLSVESDDLDEEDCGKGFDEIDVDGRQGLRMM